jgi:hypothetical protein
MADMYGFEGDDLLASQAVEALRAGADPEKVREIFLNVAKQKGADPSKISTSFINDISKQFSEERAAEAPSHSQADKTTVENYRNAVYPQDLRGIIAPHLQQPNSPVGINADNVASGIDSTAPADLGDVFVQGAKGAFQRGLGGLETAASPVMGLLTPAIPKEAYLEEAKQLKAAGDKNLEDAGNATGAGQLFTINGKPVMVTGPAQEVFSGAGQFAGAAAGGFLGEPVAAAMDKLEKGEPLSKAELALLRGTALNEAGLALGLPMKGAEGALGVAKRALLQVPGSVGLTAADRALSEDNLTERDLITAAATGLAGSFAREPEKPVPKPKPKEETPPEIRLPETDDAAFEAGKEAVSHPEGFDFDAAIKRQEEAIAKRKAPEQGDLFSPTGESVLQGDLLGGEAIEGPMAERRRRLAAEQKAAREAALPEDKYTPSTEAESPRTPEETAELEKQYIQDQQDRLNQEPKLENEPEAQADLWNVGAKKVIEDKLAQAGDVINPGRNPTTGLFQPKRFGTANAAMAQAFEDAGVRRGLGLKDESLFPDLRPDKDVEGGTGEVFEPSKNETVEQPTPSQGELPFQEDIENSKAPARKEAGMSPYEQRKARLAAEAKQASALEGIDQLGKKAAPKAKTDWTAELQRRQPALEAAIEKATKAGNTAEAARLSAILQNLKDRAGTLRREVPSYKVPTTETTPPDLASAVKNSRKFAFDREVTGAVSDDAPVHWKEGAKNGTLSFGDVLGDVASGKVKTSGLVQNFSKYLQVLGKKLGGLDASVKYFDDSDTVHTSYMAQKALEGKKPPAAYYHGPTNTIYIDPAKQPIHHYLHEGVHAIVSKAIEAGKRGLLKGSSEVAYNRLYRLYTATADHVLDGGLAMKDAYGLTHIHEFVAELFSNPKFRDQLKAIPFKDIERNVPSNSVMGASLARVKTLYDAVVKNLGKLLGMNPELTNVLDASITASHEFFKNVNPADVKDVFGKTLDVASEEKKLQGKRSQAWQITKALVFSKGIEPVIKEAQNRLEGEHSLGTLTAIQTQNRLNKVVTDANSKDVNAALSGDREAYARLDPKAQEEVKNTVAQNGNLVEEYAAALLENPQRTPKEVKRAMDLLAAGGTFQNQAFMATKAPKSMKQKLALATKAAQKVAAGRDISAREQRALDDVKEAKKYLLNKWYPESLENLETPELEELYKKHTGRSANTLSPEFKGEAKRQAMINTIGQAIQDNAHRAGAIDNMLKSAMGLTDRNDPLQTYYKALRKRVESGLEEAPEALSRLWGNIEDPSHRIASQITQLYSDIGRLRSMEQLRDQGLGTIFSPKEGMHPDHTHMISGERFGSLQGLYTTEDVARTLQNVYSMNFLSGRLVDALTADTTARSVPYILAHKAGSVVTGVGQMYKLLNVVWSMGRYGLNAAGSPLQALINGNVNPAHWAGGMRMAAENIGSSLKSNMSLPLKDMYRYHQLEYSQIQEIRGSEHANLLASMMKDAADSSDPMYTFKKRVRQAQRTGQISGQIAKEFYGAMDNWSKAANWLHNLDVWTGYDIRTEPTTKALAAKYGTDAVKKVLTGYDKSVPDILAKMSDEDRAAIQEASRRIKSFVATRNNDVNITPSRAPMIVRGAESISNSFLTYFAEIPRVIGYGMNYAVKDGLLGIKTKDPQMAMHGAMRLMGVALAAYGMEQLSGYAYKYMAGKMGLATEQLEDNDPRKKYMDNDPFLSSMAPMLLKDPNHPEAGTYVVDVNGLDPFAPMTGPLLHKPFEILSKMYAGDTEGAKEALTALEANLKGMLLRNPLLRTYTNVVNAKQPTIARTNPEMYKAAMDVLVNRQGFSVDNANRLLDTGEFLMPGFVKAWIEANAVKGKSRPIANVVAAGVGARKFDVAEDLTNYLGGKAASDINAARASYMKLLKQDFDVNDSAVKESFKNALEEAGHPYVKLQEAIAAARAQDVSDRELRDRLKISGISGEIASALIHGRPIKPLMILGDLKTDMQKDLLLNYGDEDKRKEARERFRHNERRLIQLIHDNQENQ